MKRLLFVLFTAACLLGGCNSDRSKELFETAQFEEKQNNRDHARKLYQEVVDRYPDSPLAKQAQERLTALGGSQ